MTRIGQCSEPCCGSRASLPTSFRLEYVAFRQLHHDAYLNYAHIRIGSWTRAVRCVESVFDSLCYNWQAALRGCPASRAWNLLSEQADQLSDCGTGHRWTVHCLLEGKQADVVLLHRRLRLSVEEAADLMGLPDYAVRGLLLTADRALCALPRCVAGVFTDALYAPRAHVARTAHQPR